MNGHILKVIWDLMPLSASKKRQHTDGQPSHSPQSTTTTRSARTSTTTRNSDEEYSMDQSHPPLWTAAPHPASARQQTHLQKQVDDQIKFTDCPTEPQRKPERSMSSPQTCVHRRETYTSPPALPKRPS